MVAGKGGATIVKEERVRDNRGDRSKRFWARFMAFWIVLGVASLVFQAWWTVVTAAFFILLSANKRRKLSTNRDRTPSRRPHTTRSGNNCAPARGGVTHLVDDAIAAMSERGISRWFTAGSCSSRTMGG